MRNFKFGKPVILVFAIYCVLAMFASCSFFSSFTESSETETVEITSLSLGKSNLSMKVGSMDYVSVSIKPQTVQKELLLSWSYDNSIIECDTSSNWGVTIKALKEGQTSLKCSYAGYDFTCLITVSGYEEGYENTTEPYIYSNTTVLQTSPGISEKVFVSLYGGDAGDIDGYTWTIDNSTVATIQPTGQYCIITAKDSGYARIKVTHTKATYPYYIGVYVFADATNVTYITTAQNILTMNTGDSDQSVTVNLVNGKDTSLDSSFQWEIVETDSIQSPVTLVFNGNKAVITPKQSGSCTIRVTHPDAIYPLDILCRVITIVRNVYILPDSTVVSMNGEEQKTITSSLENIKEGEYSIDDYDYKLDDYNVAEIVNHVGNQVTVTGKANGSCKLLISHPKSAYTREILLIVTGQLNDAVDASCYITTSQNYIRTKVGADTASLSISLKGGDDGDETGFIWSVKSTAIDGSSDVIKLETTNGTAMHSRAASQTYVYGTAYITPNAEGTAVITVTHPKVLYPTEILIKVLSADAVLTEPLYFSGSGLIKILNGESYNYSVELKGKNKVSGDDENIKWQAEDSRISINASANTANIVAPSYGTGSTISYITISHAKSDTDKKVLVMTADDQKTLDSMKALYSDKLYYNIEVGDTAVCMASGVGFEGTYDEETETYNPYDFNAAKWTVKNPSIATVEKVDGMPLNAIVKGLKSGTTTVTVTLEDASCDFTITVYPVGTVATEPEIYFTTSQNVISLDSAGKSITAYVSAVNLSSSEYSNIMWESDNEEVATVISNGSNANITAEGEGTAVISVTHNDSQNTLKIYVRVGSEYVMEETESVVYIKADDLITIVKGEKDKKLTATLTNWTSPDSSGFTFTSKDSSIAKVSSQSTNGTAYIEGVSKGHTEIVITHKATKVSKSVLVIVGETLAEVNTILKESVYMSTSNNTVTFNAVGKSSTVSIKAFNLDTSRFSGIAWTSADESIAQVRGNGTSATIYAHGKGVTTVTASYPDSINSIIFYIFVNTEDIVAATTGVVYISATDVLTFLKDGPTQTLQAVLVNFSDEDTSGFTFSIDNESVAKISAQSTNGIAYITPVESGQAEITISHTATELTKKVLVIVGNSEEELAGIIYLTTSQNVIAVGEGNTKNISVSVKNSDSVILDGYTWTSSNPGVVEVISSGATAVLTGNSIGTAMITVSNKACKYSLTIIAQCVDPIAASSSPYIQLTSSVLTLTVTSSFTNVTADLIGGNESDYSDFIWSTNDSSICVVYGQNEIGKIRALKPGTTYITVSHPKANYPAQILVVCDEQIESECSISVPSSIITMKPTDISQTITASLVNGSTTDKYNFGWSLDVYDVIDFQYSANVCTITPKQSGSCTITISHPKASYDQQIIVNVQEYTTFSFPDTNTTVTQGNVSFITMQVPTTKVTTHVEYSVDNSAICSISGTKAVVQIQAIKTGTTTVRAKLIASSTGVVQAESEMMVYVKEKPIDSVYITAGTTIYTVQKGKSQTLSATLTGTNVTASDSQNLSWTTSDSDVVQVTGINTDGTVKGSQIYITALKSGEALITCSHEKASSTLQFYVVVPGAAEKVITLNKNYITLTKGSSGTTVKANIENAESSSDYYDIIWTCEDVSGSGKQIAKVMGSTNSNGDVTGQTVTVYPVATGEARITAQIPDVEKAATCSVIVQEAKSFVFEQPSRKVQPFHSVKVKYTVSPADAVLTWTMQQNDDYFEYSDLGVDENGEGYLQISGIKEGNGKIYCVTDGGAKGNITVNVNWDYSFLLDTQQIQGIPTKTYTIGYRVNPADANITVSDPDNLFQTTIKKDGTDSGTGTITFVPLRTGSSAITISAANPNADNAVFASHSINAKISYSDLTITPAIINDVATNGGGTAYYSHIDGSNTIYIGDGEKISVKLNCAESKVNPTYDYTDVLSDNLNCKLIDDTLIIWSSNDYAEDCYQIIEGYSPTYNGSSYYASTTQKIKTSDFEIKTEHASEDYHPKRVSWGWATVYLYNTKNATRVWEITSGDHKLSSCTHNYSVTDIKDDKNNWGKVRDTSLDGLCVAVEDFENNPWYFIPRTQIYYKEELGSSENLILAGGIDTRHIKARYYEAKENPDTSVKSSVSAGTITINVSADGCSNLKGKTFQVILETRNCLCTYKK